MQREGEFQKATKRRGEKRTHLYNCLIPINVFSPSPTAIFFLFLPLQMCDLGNTCDWRKRGRRRGGKLSAIMRKLISPHLFSLSVFGQQV